MSLPPAVLNRIELLASHSPDPPGVRAALASFEQRQPAAFQRIAHSAAALQYLIAVFSQSNFLTREILDAPECLEQLLSDGDLHRVRTTDDFRARLESQINPAAAPDPLPFARFRRQQILRILIRDVLAFGGLSDVTAELSALADAIVETAYECIHRDLVSRYGRPRSATGEPAHFAVIALGKLGGEELNYSSDIDLMFLYSDNGATASITNKEFFKRAANDLTALLSAYTPEGLCYRVDLRLRPEGSLGEVCISLEGARQYYQSRARDWELQMMIKARTAAGDRATGAALLDFVEPKIYATTLDFSAIEALSVTRERINEKLARKKRSRGTRELDIKLDRGGIRDIEFLVQCLQRLYGGADPWVRHGGTLLAIARLQDKGFLSDAEHGGLSSAYQFLRHLEHRLQFADDRQTHALPSDPAALEKIARRMPGGGGPAQWLLAETRAHFAQVIEIYERVVYARAGSVPETSGPQSSNVVRALEQTAPTLSRSLARAELHQGYRAFEHFLEKLSADEPRLRRLNEDSALTARTLDLFEQSPYFAEELIRTPELIDIVGGAHEEDAIEERAARDAPNRDERAARDAPNDARELRRWYRREMLRIQTASICESEPIFETLERTSALADTVISRAYDIAVADVWGAAPPEKKLWVVALGRLGMREFDLASDADLVFVLCDSESRRMEQWTRVAGRLIDLVTAYTGDGVLFAVDTRLRPNGGDGPLVQTESAVKDYFTRTAEAWEGITYMKSRAVAGEPLSADLFLHHLQAIDWVRYGQSGRSRTDLKQMRARLEKEQGAAHPLKAERGGYYDIDFLLMYLRLKSAGIFFQSLNTPERIEVLESMDLLDRTEAGFLRDAATFYRALDHGLRVRSGHAEGKLPSGAQRVALRGLIKRWTSAPLEALADIREHTRELFDRLFGY
ncbi:MAG TPA: glutamine-synthetase adenylyltransferase [Bryobacteraceae bacterium]|jgi:glutamate-ammonia-ligase adenylyltransferase|nr:glutamine-synthetase adenylyltransferase [Bryobacteraceae bacterium]